MSLDGIGFIGLIVMFVVVLTWKKCEDIQSERDAKRDINELMNKGYSYDEAVWYITNANEVQ